MKSVPEAIKNEQTKISVTPALKVGIQDYGLPQESNFLRFSEFDWCKYFTPSGAQVANICCASDGSLVATDNGTHFVRITNPGPDSDFTSLNALSVSLDTEFCLVAHPTSGEMFLFNYYWVSDQVIQCRYKTSTNYGASWGDWVDFGTLFYGGGIRDRTQIYSYGISAAYKPNGDLLVACVKGESASGYWANLNYICYRVRTGGSWGEWDVKWMPLFFDNDTGGAYFTNHSWYSDINPLAQQIPVACTSLCVAYDGNATTGVWIAAIGKHQPDFQNTFSDKSAINYSYYPFNYNTFTFLGIADAEIEVNSINDITPLTGGTGLAGRLGAGAILQNNPTSAMLEMIDAVSKGIHVIGLSGISNEFVIKSYLSPDYSLYLFSLGSYIQDIHILQKRPDANPGSNLYSRGFIINDFSGFYSVAGNSDYVFLFKRSDGLYISPVPISWTYPTAGAGAGDTLNLTTERIVRISEQVNGDNPEKLDIVFDNSDGYFNSPGTGDLAVLSKGSRIRLYLGFNIDGVDITSEYARYFVDTWGYSRSLNQNLFTLYCDGAWGLLDKYIFPCNVRFNTMGHEGEYSVYAIIEMLVKAIGGTLSYTTRSSYITSFCPKIEVNPGDNAGNLLRRLLSLVPDKIKFYGNDGVIVYPLKTDTSVCGYKFPSD